MPTDPITMSIVKEMLEVSEIFLSIQGEGSRAGRPCAFVRLAGCNLRCHWCDTKYAWEGGREMSVSEVLECVQDLRCPMVEVTGGEPLIQASTSDLLKQLADAEYETLLETNGSLDISQVDPRVARIVDLKCPGSGQEGANLWDNAECLASRDEVKFVLVDRADYEYARKAIDCYGLTEKCIVILSPVDKALSPAVLAKWILADGLSVRLGLQLHRIIWPEIARGV